MPKTAPLSPRPAPASDLMASLGGLLREWLPRQRWFAGKDRPVSELGLLSMTELFPGCLHLLVHASHGGVPAPGGGTPAGDCYQLLLGVRKHLTPRLGRALIGRAEQGPREAAVAAGIRRNCRSPRPIPDVVGPDPQSGRARPANRPRPRTCRP